LACSSKLLATGYYDKDSEWWTCKSIKEHISFVSCARFDNSGLFILSGSTDKKGYVSSSYIESVDQTKQFESLPFPKVCICNIRCIVGFINYENFVDFQFLFS
jgi:hypothetical protein